MVERGLAGSRVRAQSMIDAGLVHSGGEILRRASLLLDADRQLDIGDTGRQWVSRAALKLIAALDHFHIALDRDVGLDIGASTGGFTEVLLEHGCRIVHAVDVGHDQLATSLRDDPRVILHEGLNARYLSFSDIGEFVGIITCDVSFVGLEKVLPAVMALAAPGASLIALIKPQFEVGKELIGDGIVRDPALHASVCKRIETWLAARPGWHVLGLCDSPIAGGDGNREFLIAARRDPDESQPP